MNPRPFALVFVLLCGVTLAFAQDDVRIDITTGKGKRIRIHCESLVAAGDGSARESSVQADEILAADLDNSAVFQVTRSWVQGQQGTDALALIGGKWTVTGNQLRLSGEVRDPARRAIMVKEYRGRQQDRRTLAHRFADDIVKQFTGEPGVAMTRIAYASPSARMKELFTMDQDGAAEKQLTKDRSLALSPAWAPDGSLLLFTSYRGGAGPQVYVVPAWGGRSHLVSGRSGINTSARYSPSGREIVCTLSQDGNAEIYLLDARGGSPRRLTSNRAIDTSPAWSPTGQEIAFTSDRSGAFQIYLMDREGGNVRRLTYEVNNTDSPDWSPKGDRIAFVARTARGFDVYVSRADGSGARLIASGSSNENPRWSPDGRHLVFASNREGKFALYVSDLDNRPPRKLDTGGREAVSPAWSPRLVDDGSAFNTMSPGNQTGRTP